MTRPVLPSWSRPGGSLVGLLVAYFAFPVRWAGESPVAVALSLLATTVGLALVGALMVDELRQVRRGESGRGLPVLATLLVLLVVAASLTFFLLDQVAPGEVSGLRTRTDALYFTLSTMATVGYGDVHAEGQVARALVCALIVFNVVVVASLIGSQTRTPRE